MDMSDDEKYNWRMCEYRMREEGFHYCFYSYSRWDEIEDEDFHKLRLDYLRAAKLLEEYVNNKAK